MPARSEAQQRLMGMALAAKRGKGHFSKKIHDVANSMSEKQLHDFAATKHDGLPEKKSELIEALKFKLASLNKTAKPLTNVASGPGPDMIEAAINKLETARAMVRPDDELLKEHGLNRDNFQKHLQRIAASSRDQDRFNLSENAPNATMDAVLGGLAGGALGVAGSSASDSPLAHIGVPLLTGGIGALAGKLKGDYDRSKYLNTAKLLKNYGMLNPEILRRAYPLLADKY